MTLNNPLNQPGEFKAPLVLFIFSIAVYTLNDHPNMDFIVKILIAYTSVVFINLVFIKNLKSLDITNEQEHFFSRTNGQIKYVNGIPLAFGSKYDYTLDKEIEKQSFDGFFYGSYTKKTLKNKKRIFIKELSKNIV